MKRLVILFAVMLLTHVLAADDAQVVQHTENTLRLADPSRAVTADLDELAWLAGFWRGEGFGGVVEEAWTPPSAGTMVGTFKLIGEEEGRPQPSFYEFMAILESDAGLVLRLKHFNPDVTGWEEKDDYVSFPLVKIEGSRVYFRGLTYERTAEGDLKIYLAMRTKDGVKEVAFELGRVAN